MKKELIEKAVEVFKKGGVVIFPTDTVWGIGVSIKHPQAIKKLYQIKKRDKNKPTAVLVGSFKEATRLGKINKKGRNLIKKYWPGGLTIIVKAKKEVPLVIRGKGETVGIRMPNHPLLLKILKKLKTGIVASSANFSGEKPPAKKEAIDKKIIKKIDFLVSGENGRGIASTVVDLTQNPIKIIRQGEIFLEEH